MILVSIIGDFHSSVLPVFFEFKHRIKKHIIVYDDSKHDVEKSKKIIKAQEYFLKNYTDKNGFNTLNYEIIPLKIDEDSFDDLMRCCDDILQNAKDAKEILLNTTDGLSSVSIILSSKLLEHGASALSYDRYANTYNIFTKDKLTKHFIKKSIDIKNHLRLQGYRLVRFKDQQLLQKRKEAILEITKNLSGFKRFARNYKKSSSNRGYYKRLIWQIGDNEESFVKGGIFEEYIYWLIKDNLDVDDIMTGVVVDFTQEIRNEMDILLIKDNHLHTIECKFTGNFKTSEYIYKTDSIMNYLDDDGKGMILTVSNKWINETNRARAYDNNIKFFSTEHFDEKKFLTSVKNWFKIKRNDVFV